tara:strand:- start:22 stop:351 length:330 start_codon:yes stop_codon:yes gene_type:complete
MTNRQDVAETIINQLGGIGKLTAMIGADNFSVSQDPNGENVDVSFTFKGCKAANTCTIRYDDASDYYNVDLLKFSRKTFEYTNVFSTWGVEGGQLIELFESKTGLYLSL